MAPGAFSRTDFAKAEDISVATYRMLMPPFLTRFQNSFCESVCITAISGHEAYLLIPIVTALVAPVTLHLHIQEKLRVPYRDGLNSTASRAVFHTTILSTVRASAHGLGILDIQDNFATFVVGCSTL